MFADKVEERPDSVLFVCSYNAIRSPMAAALTIKLFGNGIYARSAGVKTGVIDGFFIEVMEEVGIDVSGHIPIMFEDFEERGFDLVATLSPAAHHLLLDETRTSAAIVEYWPTLDPSLTTGNRNQKLEAYRALRDSLIAQIKRRFHY